jgi:hypothetical protein
MSGINLRLGQASVKKIEKKHYSDTFDEFG